MNQKKLLRSHLACPCGDSSDAYSEYTNGGHCFSCGKHFPNNQEEYNNIDNPNDITLQTVSYRGHSVHALEKYGVQLECTDKPIRARYPYPTDWTKVRDLENKRFYTEGTTVPELFGQDKFNSGCARAITITEGEEDALSAFEMLGSQWPVVSVQSSAVAQRDCAASKKYLDSFERIYICFDNDEPGKKAAQAVASLFPFNKIYIVELTKYKDANDYQINNDQTEFYRVWHNAKRRVPTNIIATFDKVAEVLAAKDKIKIADFPFEGIQKATFGIRTGETYLFKALEGIGKTEVFGAIEHHVLKTTDVNIAILHLEDPNKRIIQRIANYELQMPVHLPEICEVSNDQVLQAFIGASRRDNRVHIVESFENESVDDIINQLRFLTSACECKIVFFDHISRLVSGNLDGDERKTLDYAATRLSQLAQELDFALIMVSHVNDDGQTRGSRNISKEAWTVINMYRDREAVSDMDRNTTRFVIEKNRTVGITGPVGEIFFNPHTFTLSDLRPEVPHV